MALSSLPFIHVVAPINARGCCLRIDRGDEGHSVHFRRLKYSYVCCICVQKHPVAFTLNAPKLVSEGSQSSRSW